MRKILLIAAIFFSCISANAQFWINQDFSIDFTESIRVQDTTYLNGSVIFLETDPVRDNTQGRILVEDSVSGRVEYRDVSTIGSGSTDLSFSGASSPVTLNSSTGTDVTITAGGINTFSQAANNLTITATEVDGSVSNEIQNLSYDAANREVDISLGGTSAIIPLALDDGATEGLASFTAADFDVTAGNVSLDYTTLGGIYLKLDQTTPQTVSNGAPIFSSGIETTNNSGYQIEAGGTADSYYGGEVGITQTTPTAKLHITTNGIGNTITTASGIYLQNETAAAAGAQQYSPAITFRGNGWKTDATAESQTTDWRINVEPVQGTSAPTSRLFFRSAINGAAFTTTAFMESDGDMFFGTAGSVQYANSINGFSFGSLNNYISNLGSAAIGISFVSTGTTTSTRAFATSYGALTSGSRNIFQAAHSGSIAPSSGTFTLNGVASAVTSAQTGTGAVTINDFVAGSVLTAATTYRGVYINPTPTSVTTNYAIESTSGRFLFTGTTQTGSMAENFLDQIQTWNTSGAPVAHKIQITNTASGTGARLVDYLVGGTSKYSQDVTGKQIFEYTYTAAATTGAQVINKVSGSVNFAAGAGSLVVTNSTVTVNSLVFCTILTNDATFTSYQVVPAAGSFTIYPNVAPTNETRIGFFVIN